MGSKVDKLSGRYDRKVRSMLFLATLFLFLLGPFGCGSGFLAYVLPVFAGGTPAYAYLHAYGDSITFGATLQDPATQAYPALVAKAEGLTLTNHGIPSDQACDVPTRQIFPAQDAPSVTGAALYTLLIGNNDLGGNGAGPYEAVFNLCQQASLAWLALPAEDKVLATSPTVNTSGPVSIETANHWNAITTNGMGATVTFPFMRTVTGAVYVWYRIRDGSAGTFGYALDGVQQKSVTTATTPAMATKNGSSDSFALLRLSDVAAGQHKLSFMQTSVGSAGMGIVAIGLPPALSQPGLPLVLVGSIPKPLGGSCPLCDVYNKDIAANVSVLAADNLDVKLFTSGKYMSGSNLDLNDAIHPNTLGQLEIAHAVLDTLPPPPASAP